MKQENTKSVGDQKEETNTWFCPMCRRDLQKRGKAHYVGDPVVFLICRDCWKRIVPYAYRNLSRIHKGTKHWKKLNGGQK